MVDSGDPNVSNVSLAEFASRQEASEALANDLYSRLDGVLTRQDSARLVVSGGTSPVAMFHHLRQLPLDWGRITVIPSDERVAPAGHSDRNDAMIARELLRGPAAAATLSGMLPRSDPPADGEVLGADPGRFDAVVLGMGDDGHTASLFPDSPSIERDLDSPETTVFVTVPRLGAERISLTPRTLLNAPRIDLLFFGNSKRMVFEQAMQPGPVAALPIRIVLHQQHVPVHVYWAP